MELSKKGKPNIKTAREISNLGDFCKNQCNRNTKLAMMNKGTSKAKKPAHQ
jgi:hypothetical protein